MFMVYAFHISTITLGVERLHGVVTSRIMTVSHTDTMLVTSVRESVFRCEKYVINIFNIFITHFSRLIQVINMKVTVCQSVWYLFLTKKLNRY